MRNVRQGCLRRQLQFLQRQYLQGGELPFSNLHSDSVIAQSLTAIDAEWNERIYTPLVTLWLFLGQVISADHSCRAACTPGCSSCFARVVSMFIQNRSILLSSNAAA